MNYLNISVTLCLLLAMSKFASAEGIVPMVSYQDILKLKKETMEKLLAKSEVMNCKIQFSNDLGSTSAKAMDLGKMADIISSQNSVSSVTANSFLDPIISADVAILTIGAKPTVYFSRSVEAFAFKRWEQTVTVNKNSDGSVSKLEMVDKWVLYSQNTSDEKINSIINCQ